MTRHGRSARIAIALVLPACIAALAACEGEPVGPSSPLTGHDQPEDFVVPPDGGSKTDAFSATFNRNRVVSEGFFGASAMVGADAVQAFLERTPYGTRSWLADAKVGEKRAADAVCEAAVAKGINPVVLLARMQVEKSLVGRETAPSGHTRDYAFGCGCPDDRACNPAFKGLDKQLACAAETLANLRLASVDGSGEWVRGRSTRSSDGYTVKPYNHATAALYGYTPWVLEGKGGNWLVWNVTRKFAIHFEEMGLADLDDPRLGDPWVGRPCTDHAECDFAADGSQGFCFVFDAAGEKRGFCSLPCEGYCPDLAGTAPTFCASQDGHSGFCTPRAHELNGHCAAIPGTAAVEADRYIGSSGAPAITATVCLPQ
ncbi:MAG: hypothetical protein FJ087_17055 [Deltaproteobacteria bacterium]|nr:hypothetical protein [Deltaproteobacteria bacterium]